MLKCLISLTEEQTSEWGCAGVIGYGWQIQVVCPSGFKVVELASSSWVPLGREPPALPALFLLPAFVWDWSWWDCDIFWSSFIYLIERQAPCIHSLVTMKNFKSSARDAKSKSRRKCVKFNNKKKKWFFSFMPEFALSYMCWLCWCWVKS